MGHRCSLCSVQEAVELGNELIEYAFQQDNIELFQKLVGNATWEEKQKYLILAIEKESKAIMDLLINELKGRITPKSGEFLKACETGDLTFLELYLSKHELDRDVISQGISSALKRKQNEVLNILIKMLE